MAALYCGDIHRFKRALYQIAHLAFYLGWPNAMSAIMIAKELFSKA